MTTLQMMLITGTQVVIVKHLVLEDKEELIPCTGNLTSVKRNIKCAPNLTNHSCLLNFCSLGGVSMQGTSPESWEV